MKIKLNNYCKQLEKDLRKNKKFRFYFSKHITVSCLDFESNLYFVKIYPLSKKPNIERLAHVFFLVGTTMNFEVIKPWTLSCTEKEVKNKKTFCYGFFIKKYKDIQD